MLTPRWVSGGWDSAQKRSSLWRWKPLRMRRPDFQNFTNGESTNEEPPTDVGVKIFPLINGKILWGFPLIYPMISMYDIRFPSYSHSLESMQTGGGLRTHENTCINSSLLRTSSWNMIVFWHAIFIEYSNWKPSIVYCFRLIPLPAWIFRGFAGLDLQQFPRFNGQIGRADHHSRRLSL